MPPWFVQGSSETATQQSARLVHHLHKSCKVMVMSSRKEEAVGGTEGEQKAKG